MDDFEKDIAADLQPVQLEMNQPQSTNPKHRPCRPNYFRPQYRSTTQPDPPTPPHAAKHPPWAGITRAALASADPTRPSSRAEEYLIDLDEPDEHHVQSRYASSNAFAALLAEDSVPSAASISHRNSLALPPMVTAAPSNRENRAQYASISGAPADTYRRSSSNLDLLLELDEDNFTPTSRNGHGKFLGHERRQSSNSLLDEDVPVLNREEDAAWYEAQSRTTAKDTENEPPNVQSCMPRQPADMLQHSAPAYLDRAGPRSRGNPHGRGDPCRRGNFRGRGSPRDRGGHPSSQAAPNLNHSSQAIRGKHASLPYRACSPHSQSNVYHTTASIAMARANGHTQQSNDEISTAPGPHIGPPVKQIVVCTSTEAIEPDKHSPSLAAQHDTAGMVAWRTKKYTKPEIVIPLPKNLNFGAALSESKMSSKPVFPRVQEISITTGTYIDPIWHKHKGIKAAKLCIYGTRTGAEDAKQLIFEWFRELYDKKDEKWAKVWAYNRRDEKRLIKRLERNANRQKYRQNLTDEDEAPEYIITFAWALPKEPEKVLGPNYEALDPIRMDCSCWITREKRPGPAVFKIQSKEEGKVEEALKRMQQIRRSYDAKVFEVEPFAILDIPQSQTSDCLKFPPIIRIPYQPPRPLGGHVFESEVGGVTFRFKYPMADSRAQQRLMSVTESPAMQLLYAITESTKHARHFSGLLHMHIHLGTFVAQKTLNADIDENTYSYTTFAEMMENSANMDARVSAEIGDPIVETHALSRCFRGNDILAPQDAWIRKLCDVRPVYAATFEIATPEGQGDLILDVELSYESGTTGLVSKRWYRLRENRDEPRKLLDSNILNLQNGLAWQIGLDQYIAVDERNLSRDCFVFPDTLALDINAAEDLESHNFVIYRSRQDRILQVPIKTVRQKRLWRFNTIAGEWVAEIGKVDKTAFARSQPQTLFEPRWTLNVIHNKWEQLLALNKRIEVGQAAEWGQGNPASLLFPENQDNSAITGFARQDREDSDDDSEQEKSEQGSDAGIQDFQDPSEETPSIKCFEDLLDLLRRLADLVCGKS